MKYGVLLIILCTLATLACSVTTSEKETIGTPTPVAEVIGQLQTNTAAVTLTVSVTPNRNATSTPVAAPPTRIPTIFPTPLQFNTPLPISGQPAPVALPNSNSGANSASAGGGQGQLVASSGDPAAGAPQSNGFYFPETILYRSGNSVLAVGKAGGGGSVIGAGNAVRSLNGLFVATAGNGVVVVRPDGASIASGTGQTTLPSWSRDGATAYWGSGNQLVRYQGGNATIISTLNGAITKVEVAPDGSTVLFANTAQVKLIMGDGTPYELWASDGSSIIEGPVWANRNGQLGIYARLSDGRRVFMGGGFSTIDDPFEQLQQVSPINEGGRVYIRQENGGNGYVLVAVWPGLPDREFVAKTLFDVSWSPDGAQLVYTTPDGQLILLDLASGNGSVLASGGASAPIWTPSRYIVKI